MKYKKYFAILSILMFIFFGYSFHVNAEYISSKINFNDINDNSTNIELILELDYEAEIDYNLRSAYEEQKITWDYYKNNIVDYFQYQNSKLLNSYDFSSYNISISNFSPYAFIKFNNYEDYISKIYNLILTVESCEYIKYGELHSIIYDSEECFEETTRSNSYSFTQAFNDMGIINSNYTGNGINIGIIDASNINNPMNFDYSLITNYGTSSSGQNHANIVSTIIGGYYGIAPDAHLFCINYNSFGGSAIDAFEYSLNNYNIDIYNLSIGWGNSGHYDMFCKYFDYVAYSTLKTIVKSSGNNNQYISTPGLAMNILTVINVDSNLEVSLSSGYDSLDSFSYKPDMSAPGVSLIIPNIGTFTGTSLAAPMVTGVCALLMEEFSILKTKNNLLKTILHCGCTQLPSQSNFYDTHSGFGLVNYSNSRNYLLNNQYGNYILFPNISSNYTLMVQNITIPSNKSIQVTTHWLVISYCTSSQASANPTTPSFSTVSIKLYDISSGNYVATNLINSNMNFLTYKNQSSINKSYRLEFVLASQSFIYGGAHYSYEIG